jgi:hypothetical protein
MTRTTGADAELLEFGRKFEVALAELLEARARFDALHDKVLRATEKACPNLPDDQKDWSRDDADQYWEALSWAS